MTVQALVSAGENGEDHKFEVILGDKGRPYLKKKEKKSFMAVAVLCFPSKAQDLVTVEYRNAQEASKVLQSSSQTLKEVSTSKGCFSSSVGTFSLTM